MHYLQLLHNAPPIPCMMEVAWHQTYSGSKLLLCYLGSGLVPGTLQGEANLQL